MSFGFSVGDVILLSQLSYRIYSTITNGRRQASRDLTELGDVLFGLRCGLDHLQHSIANISQSSDAVHPHAARQHEMRERLDLMVKNCADTLEDLDNATAKYRDGADKGVLTSTEQSTLPRTARLKRRIAANVMKIRWDLDKESLKSYRDKLQSHTDAINLVLNTFLWSSTTSIQADGKIQLQKLEELRSKVATENARLAQLLNDIHAAVVQQPVDSTPKSLPADAGFVKRATIHAVRPGPTIARMAMASMNADIDARPHYDTNGILPATGLPIRPSPTTSLPELPRSIVSLNMQRQQIVNVTESRSQPATFDTAAPTRPSCFAVASASITELKQGLNFILSRNARANPTLATDVLTWARLIDSLVGFQKESPSDGLGLLDLIIYMNEQLDSTTDDRRRLFYKASSRAGIDDTLQRVVKASRSVRLEKEIENFEDIREEWLTAE